MGRNNGYLPRYLRLFFGGLHRPRWMLMRPNARRWSSS